jgi:hypothetical protein
MINTGFGASSGGRGGNTQSKEGERNALRGKNPFMAIRIPTTKNLANQPKSNVMGSNATVSIMKSLDGLDGSTDLMSTTPPKSSTQTKSGWEME